MILAYPWPVSALPGDTIALHVTTDQPSFDVQFYRQGKSLDPKPEIFSFSVQNPGLLNAIATSDSGWPSYSVSIPEDWESGAYIAMFFDGDPNTAPLDTTTADARYAKALIVVKSDGSAPAPILYKLSTNTYQAYNASGGDSFYIAQGTVTYLRPGGGTGGDVTTFEQPYGDIDVYDESSSRQTFAHWDVQCIRWLEAEGYWVDYCTDLDIHSDGNLSLLSNYALLLSTGHDEYWSRKMRQNMTAFAEGGGNIVFLGGNTGGGLVDVVDENKNLSDEGTSILKLAHFAAELNPPEPESVITGVGYLNGGGLWAGSRSAFPIQVFHSDHWVFGGTDLRDGDKFGDDTIPPLVGYEADGARFSMVNGLPVVTPSPYEPADFTILGVAGPLLHWDVGGFMTMGYHVPCGTIFTVASTDWPKVLSGAGRGNLIAAQMTRNLLNRLGMSPQGVVQLSAFEGIVAVASFFSSDDSFRHVIVALQGGSLFEVFYNPDQGLGQVEIAAFPVEIVDTGAFFSPDDGYRHAIVSLVDGNLIEVYFNPQQGIFQANLGFFPDTVAVAGFYTPDDSYRHAIVATRDGTITEVYFHPEFGVSQVPLATIGNVKDLSAFYSSDDGLRHVLVTTSEDDLIEVTYGSTGTEQDTVWNLPGIGRVGSTFMDGDQYFPRRVFVSSSAGFIYQVEYDPRYGAVRNRLVWVGEVIDVDTFYSPDDEMGHAIVAFGDGTLYEFFFPS